MFSVKFKVKDGRNSLPRSAIAARSARRSSQGSLGQQSSVRGAKSSSPVSSSLITTSNSGGLGGGGKKVRILTTVEPGIKYGKCLRDVELKYMSA